MRPCALLRSAPPAGTCQSRGDETAFPRRVFPQAVGYAGRGSSSAFRDAAGEFRPVGPWWLDTPRGASWRCSIAFAAEENLHAALPADYRELIEAYGGGLVDDHLLLLEPGCPNDVHDLLKISAEREEANDALWEFVDKPAEMEPGGVVWSAGQPRTTESTSTGSWQDATADVVLARAMEIPRLGPPGTAALCW